MRVSSIICDECGVQKKESNHWFIGFLWSTGNGISVRPMSPKEPNDLKHLCGEKCVLSFVSKSLRELSHV